MMDHTIYKIWLYMVGVAAVLCSLYYWLYQDIPQFPWLLGAFISSATCVFWLIRRPNRYRKLILFINVLTVTLFVYYLMHLATMTLTLLFFLPVYTLMFGNIRYFFWGQLLTAVGYLFAAYDMPARHHVIFYLVFLAFSLLLTFVSRYIVQQASEAAKYKERVEVFSKAIEARDAYTQGHSRRVSLYAVEIGRFVPGINLKLLKVAGDLHDIGKISTPDAVLLKPGRLTAEEYEIIKRHTVDGAMILRQFGIDGLVLDGTLYHHERMDGSGYPEGLKGHEIPLVARILAIADTFDAMTTTRSYRKAFEPQVAYEEILTLSGRFYDPEIVECFKRAYPAILAIHEQERPSVPAPTSPAV